MHLTSGLVQRASAGISFVLSKLLSFLKFLTLPGLEQESMREQEIMYLPHIVEASFVFSRNGEYLNLAFSWDTFVSSSEICTPPTPPHVHMHI